MGNDKVLDVILSGISDIPDHIKDSLEKYAKTVMSNYDALEANKASNGIKGLSSGKTDSKTGVTKGLTNITSLINADKATLGNDLGLMLDNLHEKNKKYFSIIKDYEIMPILIPQINRVLMFLVNECVSPDIQADKSFVIKYTGDEKDKAKAINEAIDKVRQELGLDKLLKAVYYNRYKLGREYYRILDYQKTFEFINSKLKNIPLNESTVSGDFNPIKTLENAFSNYRSSIDSVAVNENVEALDTGDKISYEKVEIDLKDLNIDIIKSPVFDCIQMVKAEMINENAKQFSLESIFSTQTDEISTLNEAASTDKIDKVIEELKKKKLNRCTIERLDPAKVFKLRAGGKTIGYFYTEESDISKKNTSLNYSQLLKDRLMKAKAINLDSSYQAIEKTIAKELSEKLINNFDQNIGVNRIEDIDLLHDYITSTELFKGNKKVTFYYKDDIIDLSREDDSILTNAVFFTKLYAMLILNNVTTKVLRGRGRQIHTVNMGATPAIHKYLENAMASLSMPETRLGTMTGSFEQLLNPLNSASDIVIPSESGEDKFITTDIIEGQNVDMDVDVLKFLLNSIVTSFGLDSAVLDVTNGNIDFAKSLSMLSLQIVNLVKGEQNDLYTEWCDLVKKSLSTSDETLKGEIEKGTIDIRFFKPKSLLLSLSNDELNNAKTFAENIADAIPDIADDDLLRKLFVYKIIRSKVSLDWDEIEEIINELGIDAIEATLKEKLKKHIEDAKNKNDSSSTTPNADDSANEGLEDETV